MFCGAMSLDQAHSPIGKDAIHLQKLRPQTNWRNCRGDPDEPVECSAHGRSQFCQLQKGCQTHLHRWCGAANLGATSNPHFGPLASCSGHPRLAKLGLLWGNGENHRRLSRGLTLANVPCVCPGWVYRVGITLDQPSSGLCRASVGPGHPHGGAFGAVKFSVRDTACQAEKITRLEVLDLGTHR